MYSGLRCSEGCNAPLSIVNFRETNRKLTSSKFVCTKCDSVVISEIVNELLRHRLRVGLSAHLKLVDEVNCDVNAYLNKILKLEENDNNDKL